MLYSGYFYYTFVLFQMNPHQVARIEEQVTHWLTETKHYDEFVSSFLKCPTNSERVACLYSLPVTESLFKVQENFQRKDIKYVNKYREEGNKLFKDKKYLAAMNAYTQSIIYAPDDSEILPLVYNNRSSASFYLKNYVLCLQDIELAFTHNYPTATCHKLFLRKGRCLYYLNHREEAVKSFQQSLIVVEKSDLPEESKRSILAEIRTHLDRCKDIKSPPSSLSTDRFNCCHRGIPVLSSPPSKEIVCAAENIEIKLDSHGGRGLFAKSDIEIGSVLIVETPFSSFLLPEFNLTHCHYCCNRVFLPFPCRQCSGVIFCSLSCRQAAWVKFHWAECRIFKNIQNNQGNLGLLASRMILTAGVDNILKFDELLDDGKVDINSGFDEEGVYNSENYGTSYYLVNHSDKRALKDLISRTISAIFYLKQLEFIGLFSGADRALQCEEEARREVLKLKYSVGGHILRNIMMLPCNAHEVSEFSLNVKNPPMSVTVEIGGAVYPVLSLLNHSCDPSVVRHSFGNVCVARTIRSIRKGEELKDNYGALYATHDFATRVEKLSQYYFKCSCEACLANWPQYFEIPDDRPIFRCLQCDGHVPIPPGNETELAKCTACGKIQDITVTILQMREIEGSYKDALTAIVNGSDDHTHLFILLNYLRFIDKHVHRPFRDVNDCQEAFKQILNIKANCFPA